MIRYNFPYCGYYFVSFRPIELFYINVKSNIIYYIIILELNSVWSEVYAGKLFNRFCQN